MKWEHESNQIKNMGDMYDHVCLKNKPQCIKSFLISPTNLFLADLFLE